MLSVHEVPVVNVGQVPKVWEIVTIGPTTVESTLAGVALPVRALSILFVAAIESTTVLLSALMQPQYTPVVRVKLAPGAAETTPVAVVLMLPVEPRATPIGLLFEPFA